MHTTHSNTQYKNESKHSEMGPVRQNSIQRTELAPKENFWCKGRLTEADTLMLWMGTTPSGLTSAHLHHPPFFTGRMPFLLPNQQRQCTEGLLITRTHQEMR